MATQLPTTTGANPIGVVSEEDERDFVLGLGARRCHQPQGLRVLGEMPKVGTPEYDGLSWKNARDFGKAIWAYTGKGVNVEQ